MDSSNRPFSGRPAAPSPADAKSAVDRALAAHGGKPGGLMPVFHAIQDALGYVPREEVGHIAHALNLSHADVLGTLTYYHDFRSAPPGRHVVKICRAEACQAVGAEVLLAGVREQWGVSCGETRADGAVTVDAVFCLGNCALGPSVLLDGKLHGRASTSRLRALLPDVGIEA